MRNSRESSTPFAGADVFAGLFYLPRLFVYHVTTTDALSLERFVVMERRLFGIMTFGATLQSCSGYRCS